MCGIAGTYAEVGKGAVDLMLDELAHRGPDGRGVVEADGARHGHVRLAMLDLTDASAQPFRLDGAVLSFNGEVWNHAELRRDLLDGGFPAFRTRGDAEVLAATMIVGGLGMINRVDGMHAFAWSGRVGHKLVRDRWGKVPLYWRRDPYSGACEWASERRAISRPWEARAVRPGHVVDLVTGREAPWADDVEASPLTPELVLARLRRAVALRLQADAPVCCLISGGLDSSLILRLAVDSGADVTAFTINLNPTSRDLHAARRLCADLDVRLVEAPVELSERSFLDAAETIEVSSKAQVEIAALCVPLARAVRANGFKACLSGEAADELFGGYGNFAIQASRVDDVRPLRRAQVERMARGNHVRCNKAFMAAGVECRLPFMDDRLVASCLASSKAENPPGKRLLKDAARLAGLPEWLVRRPKETFQGAAGASALAASLFPSPLAAYNRRLRERFGCLPRE